MVFSHGKESGPWGAKITAMAAVVRELNLAVESVDYRGMDDPAAAGAQAPRGRAAALSSRWCWWDRAWAAMSSAAAAGRLKPRGMFLLAPAFYMAGYEQYTPQDVACPTAIVHGWSDDIVPVENSIRWAGEHRATLHVLDSGHRLEDQIEAICVLLRWFLTRL